jgi:lysophospholipase L1-like esterase
VRVCQFRHSGSGQKPDPNSSALPQQAHDPVRARSWLGAAAVALLLLADAAASRYLAPCGVQAGSFSGPSAHWTGWLTFEGPGPHFLGVVSGGRTSLALDGQTVLDVSASPGARRWSTALLPFSRLHRLEVRHVPVSGPELELFWQDAISPPVPIPRYALSLDPPTDRQQSLRRLAGRVTRWARPAWVAGLVLGLCWLLLRLAGRRTRALSGQERLLLFCFLALALASLLVLTGAVTRLWSELEPRKGPLILALAFWALSPWLLVRAVRGLRRADWRSVALAAASLAVALGLGELALRRLRPYDSLPRFRWLASMTCHHVNPPGRRMFSGWVAGAPITVETNEDGLRSARSREAFLRHGTRVLVLGDSFAFGPGVPGERTWPNQLEGLLRQRLGHEDVAVANAGVIGYSPRLEEALLHELLPRYRPTLVILLLDATDVGDDDIYERLSRGAGASFDPQGETRLRYWGAVHQLLEPSLSAAGKALAYPWSLAGQALGLGPPSEEFNYYALPIEVEGGLDNRFFIYRHPPSATRPFFEATLRHIRQIQRRAQEGGAAFLLAVAPRYHHWSQRECPQNWERAYGTDEPYQFEYLRFFEAARGPDLPVLNLLPAFQATDEFPLVFPNDPHWNERGHAFVARTLADHLVQSGMLTPSPSRSARIGP